MTRSLDRNLEISSLRPSLSALDGETSTVVNARLNHRSSEGKPTQSPAIASVPGSINIPPETPDPQVSEPLPSPEPLDTATSDSPLTEALTRDRPSPASPNSEPEPEPQAPPSDAAASETGFLPVLRNVNFLTLWSGQVFSQLADKVYLVLMISLIVNRFQAAGQTISGWVSAIMIAFTIPAVLFGSVAGVFVDRWSKKTVLATTNLLRGGLVLALPLLLWGLQGWDVWEGIPIGFCVLLTITFLVSTLTQFFAPAEQAVIPLIVERRHLLSANSLYTTTMMASVIIGFAVGEPLLEVAGHLLRWLHPGQDPQASLELGKEVVVGMSYAIAGLVLLVVRVREKTYAPDHEHPHVFQDIKDGLKYLGQQPKVRAALIQLVMLSSIFAALAVLAVRLAEVMPAIESDQFGFLLAAGGVGMAIGAGLVGQFGQAYSRRQLSLVGSVGMAISLALLSFFCENFGVAIGVIAGLGAFAALVGVPMQTTIQAETPEAMRGKVFGLQNNAVNIALSLPLALAGIAESCWGLQAVILILSALAIAGGGLTWYIAGKGSAKTT